MSRHLQGSKKKSLADRVRDFWERVGGLVDELLPQPEPELIPIPIPVENDRRGGYRPRR